MPSKYWIKLYHEIIDDPKMGKLTDRLFRRTIQLFLIAGDFGDEGILPAVDDMAWRLRMSAEELETDLADLASTGIVHNSSDRWMVTKFTDRQAASTGTERWRQWRDRQRKENYYQTPHQREPNETLSEPDIDIDIETDKEEKLNGASADAEPPEPAKKASKKKPPGVKKRDPLLDHPAIIAYREEFHYHVQIPWREEVCSTVDDPEKWKTVIHDWHGSGWNPKNVKGMLEAYRNGGIGKRKEEPAGFEALRNYRKEAGLDNGE